MLDYGLAKAADSIFKHVITPAVTHASTFTAVEDLSKSSGEVTEATLRLEQSSDHKVDVSLVRMRSRGASIHLMNSLFSLADRLYVSCLFCIGLCLLNL